MDVIRWEDAVKKRPKLYFGEAGASASGVAQAIERTARLLGAKRTETLTLDKWRLVCADTDWILNSVWELSGIEQVFHSPIPFPEAGVNSFRGEALCLPFSTSAYTWAGDQVQLLKGTLPMDVEMNEHRSNYNKWARIVAFEYGPEA